MKNLSLTVFLGVPSGLYIGAKGLVAFPVSLLGMASMASMAGLSQMNWFLDFFQDKHIQLEKIRIGIKSKRRFTY